MEAKSDLFANIQKEELVIMQHAWGYVPSSFTLQLLWKVTADLLVPKEVCIMRSISKENTLFVVS